MWGLVGDCLLGLLGISTERHLWLLGFKYHEHRDTLKAGYREGEWGHDSLAESLPDGKT